MIILLLRLQPALSQDTQSDESEKYMNCHIKTGLANHRADLKKQSNRQYFHLRFLISTPQNKYQMILQGGSLVRQHLPPTTKKKRVEIFQLKGTRTVHGVKYFLQKLHCLH